MPRKSKKVPSYCLHKHSGQAVVRIHGKDRYLGEFGSPESYERYERLLANWRTGKAEDRRTSASCSSSELSINEMLVKYYDFARLYYVKDGEPTQELASMAEALLPLRQLYGHTQASEFGPKALQTVRQHLIDNDICRGVINNRFSRIKRVFKWAVAEELVPPSVYHGLQAVPGLRYGRTNARESEPVRPVADLYVAAVLPFLPPQVAGMIIIQRLTGMRPCEVVLMSGNDRLTSARNGHYRSTMFTSSRLLPS